MSETVDRNGQQDVAIGILTNRVNQMEKMMDKHIDWHDKQLQTAQAKDWQVKFGILTIILTSLAGLLVALLK